MPVGDLSNKAKLLRFDPDLLGMNRSLYEVCDGEGVLRALTDCCFKGELVRQELGLGLAVGLAMELGLGLAEEALVSRCRETPSGKLMQDLRLLEPLL